MKTPVRCNSETALPSSGRLGITVLKMYLPLGSATLVEQESHDGIPTVPVGRAIGEH